MHSFAQETCSLKKSFAKLGGEFYGVHDFYRGAPFIQFYGQETKDMTSSCTFTLIGKFSQGSPTLKIIQAKFSGFGCKGSVFISLIHLKHIMIKLSNNEDFMHLWTRQLLHIDGFSIYI